MRMMDDQKATIPMIMDSYFNYKVNMYKNRIETAFKKIKGETCYSGAYDEDVLVPSFLLTSVT